MLTKGKGAFVKMTKPMVCNNGLLSCGKPTNPDGDRDHWHWDVPVLYPEAFGGGQDICDDCIAIVAKGVGRPKEAQIYNPLLSMIGVSFETEKESE
jgi:hypothetical protein